MNETKINNINKVLESLTREEAIELCEKLIAENEELKAINYILHFTMAISDVVIDAK